MSCCKTCRFSRGYIVLDNVPTTWCHHDTPKMLRENTSCWPPVSANGWCGKYRIAWFRAIKALFGRG